MAQLRRYSLLRFRIPARYIPSLPRRRSLPRRNSQFNKRLPLAAACIALVATMLIILERRVTPQVQELAGVVAKQQAAQAIAEAVERVLAEEQVTYERLVEQQEQNGVKSIRTNALEINLLRSKINRAAEEAVRRRRARLRLPLGALLGSQLFSGSGPNIGVRLAMTGDALSDIRSDISGAGVNQTMHRVLMDLRVSLAVILPGGAQHTDVEMTICLAETVIVGNVPNGLGIITQK